MPPNLLVGPGATEFAHELLVPVVHPDLLVSPAAGDRYARWKQDLDKVETTEGGPDEEPGSYSPLQKVSKEQDEKVAARNKDLIPCWNESQPYSPTLSPTRRPSATHELESDGTGHTQKRRRLWSSNEPGNDGQESLRSDHETFDDEGEDDDDVSFIDDNPPWFQPGLLPSIYSSLSHTTPDPRSSSEDAAGSHLAPPAPPPPTRVVSSSSIAQQQKRSPAPSSESTKASLAKDDDITDTVGAIAIDCLGNIAAGSSSGGIGMKHKGRVGPAALVGIGTAVIPIEPEDKQRTCVATVTSGTGEHMATTMAAGMCASRLYSSSRREKHGGSESTDDDTALRGFVERDFMGEFRIEPAYYRLC